VLYRLVADLVVLIHGLFVVFVALGGLLALRWPRVAWIHIPAALWGAAISFANWGCPLTPIEKRLRAFGGEEAYEGGFIAHYLVPLIYPAGLTRTMQIVLGFLVVALNVAVYCAILVRRRRHGRKESTPR
jgi:hypothetical protein